MGFNHPVMSMCGYPKKTETDRRTDTEKRQWTNFACSIPSYRVPASFARLPSRKLYAMQFLRGLVFYVLPIFFRLSARICPSPDCKRRAFIVIIANFNARRLRTSSPIAQRQSFTNLRDLRRLYWLYPAVWNNIRNSFYMCDIVRFIRRHLNIFGVRMKNWMFLSKEALNTGGMGANLLGSNHIVMKKEDINDCNV
ncbi:hypothetical protein OUZ56_004841 [Daphnia magna]|uniref:Uncharacterized protein n=1 Tax=Daphnia magna TaxID=35525 RepID=A0ABQ9YRD3_9CRUS|nr:hypothetical protein OUZ56_004841 [Daphnia magna]